MESTPLVVETEPDPKAVQFLDDQIYAFNAARTGYDDGKLLAIFVRDGAGAISAGLHGWTWGGYCYIRFLWVREHLRGQGLGSRLLRRAEEEARARGALQVVLDTHSFQAPEFYRRHGYEVFGEIDDVPRGHRQLYLRKRFGGLTGT
jgi:ribosomal protein S18 acetylase RimI-like enzyme